MQEDRGIVGVMKGLRNPIAEYVGVVLRNSYISIMMTKSSDTSTIF